MGSIPSFPQKISEEKIVNIAEVNQWRRLEESETWLENVDWTHLILARGKLVPQKVALVYHEIIWKCFYFNLTNGSFRFNLHTELTSDYLAVCGSILIIHMQLSPRCPGFVFWENESNAAS